MVAFQDKSESDTARLPGLGHQEDRASACLLDPFPLPRDPASMLRGSSRSHKDRLHVDVPASASSEVPAARRQQLPGR